MYEPGNAEMHKEIGKKLKELPPGKYLVSIGKQKDIRSLAQNRYYWKWLTIISTHTGQGTGDKYQDTHALHKHYKKKFNSEMHVNEDGEIEIEINSTSELNTKEFTVYLNRIRQDVLEEHGITLPDPRDITYAQWLQIDTDYEETFSGL